MPPPPLVLVREAEKRRRARSGRRDPRGSSPAWWGRRASLRRAPGVDQPADRGPRPSRAEERLRHGRRGRGAAATRAPEPQRDGDHLGPQPSGIRST